MPEQTDQPTPLRTPSIRVFVFCDDRLQTIPAGIVIVHQSYIDDPGAREAVDRLGSGKVRYQVKRRIFLDVRPDHVEAGVLHPLTPAERTCSESFYREETGEQLVVDGSSLFASPLYKLKVRVDEMTKDDVRKTWGLESALGRINNMIGGLEELERSYPTLASGSYLAQGLRSHMILARDEIRGALLLLTEDELKLSREQILAGATLPSSVVVSDDHKDAERDARHLLDHQTSPLGENAIARNLAQCYLDLRNQRNPTQVSWRSIAVWLYGVLEHVAHEMPDVARLVANTIPGESLAAVKAAAAEGGLRRKIDTSAIDGLRDRSIEALAQSDVERVRWMWTALELWGLLDDIDTLDDAAKGDDAGFRKRCYEIQRRRFQHIDGVELDKIVAGPGVPDELRARFGEGRAATPCAPVPWGATHYLTTQPDRRGQIVGPYPGTPTLADLRRLVDAMRSNNHPIDLVEPGGYMAVYVTRDQADALWDDNEVKRLIERCVIPSNMAKPDETYGLLVGARLVCAPLDLPF